MNKYYQPTKEEFHIGFEFEYLEIEGKLVSFIPPVVKWVSQIVDDDWLLRISDDFEPENYRVRFLDKNDIESLGWKNRLKDGILGDYSKVKDDKIYTLNTYQKYNLAEVDLGLHISMYDKNMNFRGYIFRGKIRNKSELIKLLKQTEDI